jgi:hypothetical protein
MKNFRFILTVVLVLLVLAPSAFSQGSTGRLIGTVTDPHGAAIAGATVTVKDNQTAREQTVTASDEGNFVFPQLPFGVYTVTVTAQGYSNFTATEVKIDTNRDNTLNVAMSVGGLKENVTVVAGADIVNSSNGELSNTISEKQVKELPINGRNPLALLNLLPGVNPTSSSINGQRSSSTNYTRDGLNVQDNFIRTGGFVQDRPTVDDTGEFTAILQNAGAEFGGSQVVQLVTPRGGQDFHGALYEFNRNSKFTGNRFFNNLNNVSKTRLNRNQFGGSIGGPMVLPHFGENGPSLLHGKAFFFFNMEIFRQASQAAGTGTTLLSAARNGTFTYVDNGGVQRTINVLTGAGLNLTGANGTAFNNAGGVFSVDPLIQSRILSRIPTACNGNFTGINFTQVCNFNLGALTTRDQEAGRVDIQFNDTNSLNFIVKRNVEDNPRTDLAYGFQTVPFVFQGSGTNFYAAAYNMSPTPSFSNEIRGGYQRSEPFFNEGGVPKDFVFSTNQTPSGTALAGIISNPEGSFRDQGRNTDYWNLQDNANYTRGNHSFRFGGQFQSYKTVALNFAGVTPLFTIANTGTANSNIPGLVAGNFPGGASATDRNRANNLRWLLGGIISRAALTANLVDLQQGFRLGAPTRRDLRYEQWSGYGQDQWRVSPRLTLNLGLRYDLFTPLRNVDQIYLEARVSEGQTAQQAALDPNGVYQIVGGNAGKKGAFFKADRNNFGPTFSLAWSPDFKNGLLGGLFPGEGRTVIRGGYRISYNSDEYERAPDNALLNHTGLGSQTVNALNGTSIQLRSILTPRSDMPSFNPVPGTFATPSIPTVPFAYSVNNTAAFGFQGTVFVVDPHFQVPLVHEYNLGIQREIGWNSAIEFRYVGARSHQLVRTIDYNQVEIRNNGFLADFIKAQNNLALSGGVSGAFNPAIPGSQPLTVFPTMPGGGFLNDATVISQLQQGIPGDLAVIYITNAITGPVKFLANPNTFVANVLGNGGQFNYNAVQAEIRRRPTGGLSFALNYTFQKVLADTTQETQTNVDPFLDNANLRLNYARPDYDRTHTINGNMNWELPFGRGKHWLNDGGVASKIFGGFQMTNIVNISTGEPTSIRDAGLGAITRGTLNRSARSALQPATSSLTPNEIKKLIGVFRTPNGIFYIDPSVLQAIASNGATSRVVDLTQPLPAGFTITSIRGAGFSGAKFSLNAPGSTGNLPINFINGPMYFNWNMGVFRNFKIGETRNLQLRFEAFNVLNRANFFIGESSGLFNVNSTSFGRITSTYDPRIIQFGARFDF